MPKIYILPFLEVFEANLDIYVADLRRMKGWKFGGVVQFRCFWQYEPENST